MAEKRKILGLIGGSRQDDVFRGSNGSGFSRALSRATDHQVINPIAVAARQSGAESKNTWMA
ncbi:hypothetical protein [Rhizobium sp. BK456]|uniref:hypothetical protein n=1 Tax=Rhizobium sp. BK456 TaxID=2587007 RepID=UPI00161582E5|nr:hypothetical protein [Rhizobium sp. BK456]MBB3521090.1 hypothetical protein [Rhizobium sp. BK456]